MKIPKRISPDRIKDAIIEIRYTTKIPFEIAIGLFFKSLDDSYKYTNRPLTKQSISTAQQLNVPQEITFTLGMQSLFYNERIKIQLQPNSIIFNCINEYITWDVYRPEIEKAINQLSKAAVVDEYNRIGIRYISEYPNIDLMDCIRFTFTFGMEEVKSETYSFHSEFVLDDSKVYLNLNNKVPTVGQKALSNQLNISVTPISTVDIDVIHEQLHIDKNDISFLLSSIDSIHTKEKNIFFTLLKEEFIKTLNPEY